MIEMIDLNAIKILQLERYYCKIIIKETAEIRKNRSNLTFDFR